MAILATPVRPVNVASWIELQDCLRLRNVGVEGNVHFGRACEERV